MEIVVKAYLQKADASVEVRRVPVSATGQSSSLFKETFLKLGAAFPELANKVFSLKWKDSDGDLVMISSDDEMLEALADAKNSPLKVFITIEGQKETVFEQSENEGAAARDESNSTENRPNSHQKQEPFEAGWTFDGPLGMPGFGFGGPINFHTRKRGHPDSHNPRGHFGFHFGPRGHHFDPLGARGAHFGHMGSHGQHPGHMGPHGPSFDNFGPHGRHFSHLGPRGCHFENFGPRGQNLGHRGHPGHRGGHGFSFSMGMHGPFEGQEFCDGQQPCPPPFPSMFFDHHFDHHHGDYNQHQKQQHEEGGWKAKLRDAVPTAHRRWAKIYIRNWRLQHLKNATSTSSESDQEIFSLEAASVPEAYAAWLDILLPEWHKRQGQEDACESDKNSEEKNKLKASVPLEFRRWVKWYLARHFGKKEAPKFRKEGSGDRKMDKLGKKGWKKAFKLQTLATSIPQEHRTWAKTFIRAWRLEHKVPETGGVTSSENEDTETKTAQDKVTVPDDYAKWMGHFLTKWHLQRGVIDGQDEEFENEAKKKFMETVPKNFQKWVKCFLWQHYGEGADKKDACTFNRYQQWLQAFQQKWLQEQSQDRSMYEQCLASSNNETTAGPGMESSLKKLCLQDEQGNAKNVDISPSGLVPDNDNSDAEVNSDFHCWFKHALGHWDGRTAPGLAQEGASNIEQIPPHLYHHMYKMMMKNQKKLMKQEFKQAKQSVKAAMKAQKYHHF